MVGAMVGAATGGAVGAETGGVVVPSSVGAGVGAVSPAQITNPCELCEPSAIKLMVSPAATENEEGPSLPVNRALDSPP